MTRDRDWYLDQRALYQDQALGKAFPDDHGSGWDPAAGWQPNRSYLRAIYGYYRDVFNGSPEFFWWAGLGRMAGAEIVAALDQVPDGEDALIQIFLQAGRDIFDDLAWQHEVASSAVDDLLDLASFHDAERPGVVKYRDAWEQILTGEPDQVGAGSELLLQNEQFSIVQPWYDKLWSNDPPSNVFDHASAFTRAVHPYHRDFIIDCPGEDIRNAPSRWKWITLEGGMWQKWAQMPAAERARLVNLDIDALMNANYGPLIQELLPPGGP